jgi:lipase chaperone LimK
MKQLLTKNNIFTLIFFIILIAVGFKLFLYKQSDSIEIINSNNQDIDNGNIEINPPKNTVASSWKWQKNNSRPSATSDNNEQANNETYNFTEKSVYKALYHVRLDDNNNVIIDNETLNALNNTLDDERLKLDEQSILQLQMFIKKGLPGNAGEEVAKIVGGYYQYLEAAREFNAVYEGDPELIVDSVESIEQQQNNYQELSSLRHLYLDTDVATQLFSQYDANANYMFEVMKIQNDESLSDEEKQKISSEIALQHSGQSITVNNWDKRYQDFLVAKQNIMSVAISDDDKQAQLTELMHQHFSSEELDNVRHLQLDKP